MKMKKAAVLPAAGTNKLHTIAYRSAPPVSSLKILIGGLLLFGNKSQKVFWPFFDATLRQYLDLKLASQSALEQPESTNATQRVSG